MTFVDNAPATDQPKAHGGALSQVVVTPGIVHGLDIREGHESAGANPKTLVVHPGIALAIDGSLIEVDRPTNHDLGNALASSAGRVLELVLVGGPSSEGAIRLRTMTDEVAAVGTIRLASIEWSASKGLVIAPVYAGLGSRRLSIGSARDTYLVVDDHAVRARGTIKVEGRGPSNRHDDGCLVVGKTSDSNICVDNRNIGARTDGVPSELSIQPAGGVTRFGGSIEGPERDPLTIVGGSDLSLGGGGVLMIGRSSGPNLVFDENELMARDDGRSVPLMVQLDGSETRFGGPLRGADGGPLTIAGGSDLSLGGDGVLLIGSEDAQHLVLDENEILAGNGTRPADLYLQWHGGTTAFGGPVRGPDNHPLYVGGGRDGVTRFSGPLQLVANDAPGLQASSWDLRTSSDLASPDLEIRHNDHLVSWFEADGSGRLVTRCDQTAVVDPVDLTDALEVVQRLRPITYRQREGADQVSVGFVAEEVADAAPDLVTGNDDALGIRPADFAVIAIAAIKEQQKRIDVLERVVAALTTGEPPEVPADTDSYRLSPNKPLPTTTQPSKDHRS